MNFSLAVYRVCKKLPESEPMAGQLKKTANELVGDLVMEEWKEAQKRAGCLIAYFEISRNQDWINPVNWEILKKESFSLKEQIGFFEANKKSRKIKKEGTGIVSHNAETRKKYKKEISSRQKEILSFLESKRAVKFSDFTPLFKDQISERTLRADLQDLLNRNLINREGINKNSVYISKTFQAAQPPQAQ